MTCVCVCVCVWQKSNANRTVMRNTYRKKSFGNLSVEGVILEIIIKRRRCEDVDLIRLAERIGPSDILL